MGTAIFYGLVWRLDVLCILEDIISQLASSFIKSYG
jgi:hypothetical protein